MQIIRDLEQSPRGVYTGAIGFIAPGGRAQFNVAIRTVAVDALAGEAEYGTGSGIIWDSDSAEEYQECLVKARVLTAVPRAFDLLESLLWTPESGCFLFERHLARLRDSAEYFVYPFDEARIRSQVVQATQTLPALPHKLRLLLDRTGRIRLEATPLGSSPSLVCSAAIPQLRVTLSATPVSSTDTFLFHKTTRREVYEQARAERPGFDDVLLWNERHEITEFTNSNAIVQLPAGRFTPPIDCGLLAGTFRAELLAGGVVQERVIRLEELETADAVWAVNSVRGWQSAVFPGA
jgi:para-aminobenzoate synthetase/4-amino-4-deoxychorismate lyase